MDLKELDSFKMSDAIAFHDQLNPKLFYGQRLRPDVDEQLQVIARDFLSELGIRDLDVKDVTISGSNAAYSYTPNSDLDLHILVDLSQYSDDEVYQELFHAKKNLYNDSHDITINGIPVELYIQDASEPVVSLGEYSILQDKWLRLPTKRRSNLDQTATKQKYEKLSKVAEYALHTKDLSKLKKVLETIKRYRQAGLDLGGEFGPENLAYKVLRSQGVITKLYDLRDKLHSQRLSIEGMYSVEEADEKMYKHTPTIEQLVIKYKVPKRDLLIQLEKGMNVELEHTSERNIARKIALDHIGEDPHYYNKLEKANLEEARRNPEQNRKFGSGKYELINYAEDKIDDKDNWAVSMTMEPKLGVNPRAAVSEDTPKGIYFYPLRYFMKMADRNESLPWGDNFPYLQLFQYDRSGEMTQQTKVDPAKLKQALLQYCPEEVIQQAIDEPEYDGTPYWFIYDCLSRLGQNDETNVVRWNKVLRDLGFTSVYDPGNGWIAYNEPTQGVVLDPRIIKQHKMFDNRNPTMQHRRYDIQGLADSIGWSSYFQRESQLQRVYNHPDEKKVRLDVAKSMLKPFLGKSSEEAKEMGYDQALKAAADKVIEILKQPINEATIIGNYADLYHTAWTDNGALDSILQSGKLIPSRNKWLSLTRDSRLDYAKMMGQFAEFVIDQNKLRQRIKLDQYDDFKGRGDDEAEERVNVPIPLKGYVKSIHLPASWKHDEKAMKYYEPKLKQYGIPFYYDTMGSSEDRNADVPRLEEASGYIPSEKQKNDPRFKTALTVDVNPYSIKKNAKAFGWLTSRAGIPPTAKPSGKI